jgi:TonB family protein
MARRLQHFLPNGDASACFSPDADPGKTLEGQLMMKDNHRKGLRLFAYLWIGLAAVAGARAQEQERKIVKKVEAKYPDILKRKGIGGTVRLKALVKADGTVKSVEVAGGNPILADAAKTAVLQWKFSSAGAESIVDVSLNFDPNY